MSQQVITIEQEGRRSRIKANLDDHLSEIREKLSDDQFVYADKDGTLIEKIFEKDFTIRDIYNEITNTVFTTKSSVVQVSNNPSHEQLNNEIDYQKNYIHNLKIVIQEQQLYSKQLEEQIMKLQMDDDANNQRQYSIINNGELKNRQFKEEEEIKQDLEYISDKNKQVNDKDYFKNLLLSKSEMKDQKKRSSLDILLYPAQNLKELSIEEQHQKRLEHIVNNIRPRIENDLSRLEPSKREMTYLLEKKDLINMNENAFYNCTVLKCRKVCLSAGVTSTICQSCNITCHENCSYFIDSNKNQCLAIQDDYCTVCPKKCFWNQHVSANYTVEYYLDTQIRTVEDLRKIYCLTDSDILQSDQILLGLMRDYLSLKKKIFDEISNLQTSMNHFNQLANKPNTIKATEVVQIMINHEKENKKLGYQLRLKGLEEVKCQFEQLNQFEGQKREDIIEEHFYNAKQALIDLKLNNINFIMFK